MKPTSKIHFICLLAASLAVLPCGIARAGEAPIASRNMAILQGYADAMNRADASYLDEYLGPDYVYHGPGGDLDADGFKAFHAMVLSAFPGLTITIDDMIADEDKVVARWTLRGVHRGEFQGIPPTGKEVTITGIIISRFSDGKAVEEWEEANILGLMKQLGAMAPPAHEGRQAS